ncbi:MAG: hypothetical protein IPN71_08755 [Fibrobacteres bacterium]|nr:hypothetical protein [Fibrobacterota bacterium]
MNPRHFVSLSAVFCLLGGFSAPSVQAAEVRASGKVLDLKGSPLNGVTVKMSGSDEVATTDNSGDWTLGVGTDVLPRKGIGGSFLTSGLFLEQGRIRVSFWATTPRARCREFSAGCPCDGLPQGGFRCEGYLGVFQKREGLPPGHLDGTAHRDCPGVRHHMERRDHLWLAGRRP